MLVPSAVSSWWKLGASASVPLEWSESVFADRVELQLFECAYPVKAQRKPHGPPHAHPRPFQHVVQSYVRAFEAPAHPPKIAIVGRDEQGIAAFAEFEPPDESGGAWIWFVARANRVRYSNVGAEALAEVLERLRALGADDVTTKIHRDNHASKRLAKGFGFEWIDEDEPYGYWALDLRPTEPDETATPTDSEV